MVNFTILAGGYSSAIASYLFNSDANTLTFLGQNPSGTNPSWVALHPTNKSILYASNEDTVGAVQSFIVQPDGLLSSVASQIGTGGNGPAFITPLSTGEIAALNYGSGNAEFIPTSADDPAQLIAGAPLITFQAAVSNPHMALEVGSEIFVSDLGANTIWRLNSTGTPGGYQVHGQINQPAGSGPRHIAVRNDQLYTIHETDSTLTQQTIPADLTVSDVPLTANFSVIPPGLPAGAVMYAAEIQLAEASTDPASPFTQPYIYISQRNEGVQDPRGDAIAIYAVEPELSLVKYVYTGLDQIRGMQLSGGPENEYLVAAGAAGSTGTIVLQRVAGGADLQIVASNLDVPTRTGFVWIEN